MLYKLPSPNPSSRLPATTRTRSSKTNTNANKSPAAQLVVQHSGAKGSCNGKNYGQQFVAAKGGKRKYKVNVGMPAELSTRLKLP